MDGKGRPLPADGLQGCSAEALCQRIEFGMIFDPQAVKRTGPGREGLCLRVEGFEAVRTRWRARKPFNRRNRFR
jgi:hypothetical protein